MVKLAVWMNMPGHHQSGFYEALRQRGVDLCVNYYGNVTQRRREQGWAGVRTLPAGERFVAPQIRELYATPDWHERVHIVPGYGSRFLRALSAHLSVHRVPWMHWSERASGGLRWVLTYPLKAWYARRVNRNAVAALAIGELTKLDFVRWGINPDKISILPYSGLLPPPATEVDAQIADFARDAAPLFLYVGALYPMKGVGLLIEAFASLARAYPKARLALVGRDESGGRYARLLKKLGLSERILLRGAIPFERLATALCAADVLVQPSLYDGWGMTIAEAAGSGKALIASDACGATAHLVRHGWNGFSVPAGDVVALVQAMQRYASDTQLARLHGARSPKLYEEVTPERNAERFLNILLARLGKSTDMGSSRGSK
ncbi:MAG: glycosyltransferase family 4 protein [Steroidobacteraceae bacterium]|nr:glycosyltransferase family 4 protein [Steroidobacteraceae bacterium]